MNTALATREQNVVSLPIKRSWSDADKKAMVHEAQSSGFSVAARKYGVATSQLFTWQKQFRLAVSEVPRTGEQSVVDAYQASLRLIGKLEQLATVVLNLAPAELAEGKLTSYNASCVLANMTNSVSKIQSLKIETLRELAMLVSKKSLSPEEARIEREVMLMANRELRAHVKEKIDREASNKNLLKPTTPF